MGGLTDKEAMWFEKWRSRLSTKTFTFLVVEEPISAKRKQLELNLIREIETAIASGLDLQFIAIELGKVTNVRVSLKDEQTT